MDIPKSKNLIAGTNKTGTNKECTKKMATSVGSKIRTKKEKLPKPSTRFDNYGHWPQFDDIKMGRKGFKCKKKGCEKNTSVFREKCNVHLCFVSGQKNRNCFKDFHFMDKN